MNNINLVKETSWTHQVLDGSTMSFEWDCSSCLGIFGNEGTSTKQH